VKYPAQQTLPFDAEANADQALTSSLKAGWSCFGIGLALSWFLPFGHVCFSIAIVTAIVAMVTHQLKRGLVLLLSSFAGSALSALIFFSVVAGTLGIASAPASKQLANEINRSSQALQAMSYGAAPSIGPSRQTLNIDVASRKQQQSAASAQAAEAAAFEESARARREEAIRQTQQQGEGIDTTQADIDEIQKSIDWYEEQIRNCRSKGKDGRWYEEHRDALFKRRSELSGK
jgi:hypothetical protein